MIRPTEYVLIFFAAICSLPVFSQCVNNAYPFRAGERLNYEVSYNWGVVWVDAGKVSFKTDTLISAEDTLFFFDSYGESYRFYDWFYKVRDRFQSEVKKDGFNPVWFTRDTREGGYSVNNRYDFFWEDQLVASKTENSDKGVSIDTFSINPCTFDVLSAIYYARTFEFEDYKLGEKIPMQIIIDGESYDLFIRYLGREIKKSRTGKAYDCIKFSAMLVEGTIFSGGEDMVVWVTADENKVPIMVEAKILIGSVKAYLTSYEKLLTELHVEE